MRLKLGRPLSPGTKSASGMYAIVAKRRDRILRICLIQELAELMSQDESRYLAEVWLVPKP